jgi:hypothetical protein
MIPRLNFGFAPPLRHRRGGGELRRIGRTQQRRDVGISEKTGATEWQRSVFNDPAQIIVQSTKEHGEIKLTANADGLSPATASVPSQPCTFRPAAP